MSTPLARPDHRAVIRIVRGPRAVEAALLEEIGKHLDAARENPALLALPVRVIVPSASLRLHVAGALMRHLGRPAIGVTIQSLYGAAAEIVERSGKRPPGGQALFPILVRRAAREEAVLHEALDDLLDGYTAVTGTVADLIDAGLAPPGGDALLACLKETDGQRLQAERAKALVRVAVRVAREMRAQQIGRSSAIYAQALALLAADPQSALPARAIFIHGFADATGAATRLIEGLLRARHTTVFIDTPPDPAEPKQRDPGAAFTDRFLGHLRPLATETVTENRASEVPSITLTGAPGAQAEVRAVGDRIRSLLDAHVSPERIAVVMRQPGPYRIALRLHFTRLGIPFSGPGIPGPTGPVERKVHALLDLLHRREEALTDRWLDCADPAVSAGESEGGGSRLSALADLRLATHAQGLVRLGDIATLDVDSLLSGEDSLRLPARHGLWIDEEAETDESSTYAKTRKLSRGVLHRAAAAARALSERWRAWPAEAPLRDHFRQLQALLTEDLAWPGRPGDSRPVRDALERIEAALPGSFAISYEEFVLLLREELAGERGLPFGGAGAGVQILSVVDARGRTFEHLFLPGMNRDVFPRIVMEDPLLPDGLRWTLASALPDIPIKERGFDEERFLFASLIDASPQVHLSWQDVDDDGKAKAPSPLLARLPAFRAGKDVSTAPALQDLARNGTASSIRPAHEHAVLAGLHGSRARFETIFAEAVKEGRSSFGGETTAIDPVALAAGRMAVLNEMDPDRDTPGGKARYLELGPYHGFIGARSEKLSPREQTPFITRIESMAGCPWRALLVQTLRVEPAPDTVSVLPEIDALLIGKVVHGALDRITRAALGPGRETLEEALQRGPVAVSWPGEGALTRALEEAAREALHEAGIGFEGLARVLARITRPYVENARTRDWPEGGGALEVIGTELQGVATLKDSRGRPRAVRFRADRADRVEGHLRLTDYKTGKPVSEGAKESTRLKHFLEAIRKGKTLQGVAYVLGAPAGRAAGRYLFLNPDTPDHARNFEVKSEEPEPLAAFQEALKTTLDAWDAGSFFPRLIDPEKDSEPANCEYCTVREACLRGDTGATNRLADWVGRQPRPGPGGGPAVSAESALVALWRLQEKRDGQTPDEEEET